MLDPDIRRLLDTYFNVPTTAEVSDVAALRAGAIKAAELLGGDPEPVAWVRNEHAPAPHGAVALRTFRPQAKGSLPLLLYAHGGGWVTGNLDSHDRFCRVLANRLEAVVVAVDYRCAPEHVFPAALDDVEAAWNWASCHASALQADAARLMVGGDSSGGNLAAALTLRLRDRAQPQPRLQLLIYPALDATCAQSTYTDFATGFNLTAAQMRWFWAVYGGDAPVNLPELSPLAHPHLAGLAPAVVAVAAIDILRGDGLAYAHRLRAAGVPTTLVDCSGTIHGFVRWTGAVPAAGRWVAQLAADVRTMLG
ncbi:MAG: alpha/beta hydrolase [Casimicrobiaceae bacterium]